MPEELISRRTRTAFRELGSRLVLGAIDDIWQDEGFAPHPDARELSGDRRTKY